MLKRNKVFNRLTKQVFVANPNNYNLLESFVLYCVSYEGKRGLHKSHNASLDGSNIKN